MLRLGDLVDVCSSVIKSIINYTVFVAACVVLMQLWFVCLFFFFIDETYNKYSNLFNEVAYKCMICIHQFTHYKGKGRIQGFFNEVDCFAEEGHFFSHYKTYSTPAFE